MVLQDHRAEAELPPIALDSHSRLADAGVASRVLWANTLLLVLAHSPGCQGVLPWCIVLIPQVLLICFAVGLSPGSIAVTTCPPGRHARCAAPK
jgi:hypothetical protein